MSDTSIRWPRWWVPTTARGFAAVGLTGVVLVGAWVLGTGLLTPGGDGSTTPGSYLRVDAGMSRTAVEDDLGPPSGDGAAFPTPASVADRVLVASPPGSTCDLWSEAASSEEPAGVMRVCYLDDRVVQRASWGIEGGAGVFVVWAGRPFTDITVVSG